MRSFSPSAYIRRELAKRRRELAKAPHTPEYDERRARLAELDAEKAALDAATSAWRRVCSLIRSTPKKALH
jgi:hypothetical protein